LTGPRTSLFRPGSSADPHEHEVSVYHPASSAHSGRRNLPCPRPTLLGVIIDGKLENLSGLTQNRLFRPIPRREGPVSGEQGQRGCFYAYLSSFTWVMHTRRDLLATTQACACVYAGPLSMLFGAFVQILLVSRPTPGGALTQARFRPVWQGRRLWHPKQLVDSRVMEG
jgi:hypothetical protein